VTNRGLSVYYHEKHKEEGKMKTSTYKWKLAGLIFLDLLLWAGIIKVATMVF